MIQRVCWATQSADSLIDQLQEPVYADTAPVLHKSNYTWKSGLKFTWNDMKYSIAMITSWYGKIVLLTLCEGIRRPPVPLIMLSLMFSLLSTWTSCWRRVGLPVIWDAMTLTCHRRNDVTVLFSRARTVQCVMRSIHLMWGPTSSLVSTPRPEVSLSSSHCWGMRTLRQSTR